ncbi:DUF1203 domain-containing protein [Thalassotalea ganghwensis]
MNSDFQFIAIEKQNFNALLLLDEQELAKHQAKWMTVDEEPGYPCRVSMVDAKVGEKVLFLPYWHHDVESAYKAVGTILVRESAETAKFEVNEVPRMLLHRLLSIRAYDTRNIMIAHDICEGTALESQLKKQFANPSVSYLHLHYASPGCFCCAVCRAN